MRSVVYDRFGDPAEVLTLGERPTPGPGPGQIRVRMVMSPIHNHDLWTIRGDYGHRPDLPAMAGSEAMGVVDALGEGVTKPAIGTRVVVSGLSGAWSEYFVAPAARAVPLPDAISDETGCQLIAMPLSTLMLLEDLEVTGGQWIIQNAANGAVGKLVATLGKLRGLNVISLVRRDAGIAEMAALGIGNVISTEQAGWEKQVETLAGGEPIVRGIESVGGDAANQLMGTLADGGILVVFGSMSSKPLVLDSGHMIFKHRQVRGFWGATRSAATSPADMGRMIGELVAGAASGELKLSIEASYDLADAAKAAAASDVPGRSGKIALRG